MSESLTVRFDSTGIGAALDQLAAEAEALVRPSAQAGSQVLYDEVKARIAGIGRVTGNLERSIYQVYSKDNSSSGHATYHISWNAKRAPHGHLVEFGHIQTRHVYQGSDGKWYTSKQLLPTPKRVAARPFIRPAFDAKRQSALEASKQTFETGMQAALNAVRT